jgi:hypothetical protein
MRYSLTMCVLEHGRPQQGSVNQVRCGPPPASFDVGSLRPVLSRDGKRCVRPPSPHLGPGTQAIIRVSRACGLRNEASPGAPGIHVRIRVRSRVRTGISGEFRALVYGLFSQPCRHISAPSANALSGFLSAGVFLAGCFRHLAPSLEPVCAVCNVSCRGDCGAVGVGTALATKAAGAGSSSLQSLGRHLLRSFRVSSTPRNGWRAQTASAKRRTGTCAAAHHFSASRGR